MPHVDMSGRSGAAGVLCNAPRSDLCHFVGNRPRDAISCLLCRRPASLFSAVLEGLVRRSDRCGGPAGEEVQPLAGRRPRLGAVEGQLLAAVAGELDSFEVECELADDGVVEPLRAGAVQVDVVRGPSTRNSSLRVESSPMRSVRRLSYGSRAAAVQRMPTMSVAIVSQSSRNSFALGLRNMKRAPLIGRTGSAYWCA